MADIDEVSRHVRSPSPCSDPAAALTELKRWWASLMMIPVAWKNRAMSGLRLFAMCDHRCENIMSSCMKKPQKK